MEFKSGEYDYDTFNQMIQETGWMGCFPFYAYEDSDKNLSVPLMKNLENLYKRTELIGKHTMTRSWNVYYPSHK